MIRDVSDNGFFFQPGADVTNQRFKSVGKLHSMLRIGDQFLMSYDDEGNGQPKQSIATLCWTGFSWNHKCHGYGIHLEPEP